MSRMKNHLFEVYYRMRDTGAEFVVCYFDDAGAKQLVTFDHVNNALRFAHLLDLLQMDYMLHDRIELIDMFGPMEGVTT